MKAFQQPVLSNDKHQLNNRLKYSECALSGWKNKKESDSEYKQSYTDKNIKYFTDQIRMINDKLK